jgi:hypothetical protein
VPLPKLHLVGPPPLPSQGHRLPGHHRCTRASRPPPPAGAAPRPRRRRSAEVGEARALGSGSPRRPGPRLHRPVGGSYTLAAMEAPPLDLVRPAGPGGCRAGSSLFLWRGRVVPARSDEATPFQMLLSEREDGRGAGGREGEMGERG